MNMEKIEKKPLEEEMKESYLDYALSVIVSRALPDIRDGLKPVQRRILYTMWEDRLWHDAKYRKSATVVGSCLGRYHPHGDQAVYDAAIRMAQDFSLRYPLIQGQGNVGSVDEPSEYAAMRYVEMKMSKFGEEMLKDIEKNTVDFMPNYDGTRKEPVVLPSPLPQLLLNGSSGIAVGVATSIPPHNLDEVCDGLIYLIENPQATNKDLLKIIKGPDFPTGGIVFGGRELEETYSSGKGSVLIRAKTEVLEKKDKSWQIVIREIPYQVNKSLLLKRIGEIKKEGKIQEIREIKDLSDKEGIRIVMKLKKSSQPKRVLNRLFTLTSLQEPFYFNLVALSPDFEVKTFSLKEILTEFLKHREKIVRRRTEFELAEIEKRIEILTGFKVVLPKIILVIDLIRRSKDKEKAKINLEKKFHLSEKQASAILEMKLYQLNRLERERIELELKEKKEKRKELKKILEVPGKISEVIKKEIRELKEKYTQPRRTEIIFTKQKELKEEDLIEEEPMLIMMTRDGYLKRISPQLFPSQARGGQGLIGFEIKENDFLKEVLFSSTLSDIYFFTNQGKVFHSKTYEIPELTRPSRGEVITNLLDLFPEEKVSFILTADQLLPKKYLILATKNGLIKKIKKENLEKKRKKGLKVLTLAKNDFLKSTKLSSGQDEVILFTALGQSIRFKEKEIRVLSREAKGLKGIKLKKGDEIIDLQVIMAGKDKELKIFVFTENGFGKKTPLSFYREQKRGGLGIKAAKISLKTGKLVKTLIIDEKNLPKQVKGDLIIVSRFGQVLRIPLKSLPLLGRVSQGVRLMRFKDKNDKLASVTLI